MKKMRYHKASKGHTIIKVFGFSMLVFLIIVSIANAEAFEGIPNSSSNNVSNLNKTLENDIKTQDIAIEINPQDSMAWNNKGIDLGLSGKSDEAIKAFEKAIEINPQDSKAWYHKGNVLSDLNKSDEAIKAYDKEIEIDPQD